MQRPEFELIDWIRGQVRDRGTVSLGIGDDAACLKPNPDRELLVATDMLMEGVHFEFSSATPQQAGRKALAVNLSDIAAMGGRATAAFVSVALPSDRGMQFARDVHTGLIELANDHDVILAGGDTNSWNGPLVINVAVLGEPWMPRPVSRKGAQPGDWLFVTGALGGSLVSGRHLNFPPRLAEAQRLVNLVEVHAMLDVSDGLAADLHHILKASRVGAILFEPDIPLTQSAKTVNDGRSPLMHGLSDGEDFELLFAVAPEAGRQLLSSWNMVTSLTRIGEISTELDCRLRRADGKMELLPPIGWTHRLGEAL